MKTIMALKNLSKALNLVKMYYDIYKGQPFYIRGTIPYLDEMIKSKLVEVRHLTGGVLVIRILEASKLLGSIKLMEENEW